MYALGICLSSAIFWYCGFMFSGNVYFRYNKIKNQEYDSVILVVLMCIFWWFYLPIVLSCVLGTLFGRFLLFIEGTK